MRASMEVSDINELDEIPIIKVTITKGDHDCCIRISDMGGGASRLLELIRTIELAKFFLKKLNFIKYS